MGGEPRPSCEDLEVAEVEDSSQTVHDWRHPNGSQLSLGPLPFQKDELSPPDAFDDLEPEELDFQEATGNEDATFERLYQRAALVLWPRPERIAVLARGGLESTVPFLGELTRQWQANGSAREDPLWEEAHRLAAQIRHGWPDSAWERRQASRAGHGQAVLRHLADLGDREEIEAFVAERTGAGAYGPDDNEGLATALKRLPPARADELLAAVITHNAAAQGPACAGLLARCAGARKGLAAPLHPAALALLRSLPGDGPDARGATYERRPEVPTKGMVVDLLGALERIDAPLAAQAVDHFLCHPSTYPVDRMLLPATLCLEEQSATHGKPSVESLRTAVVAHLRARIALPLEPPADWRRPSAIRCTCTYCRDLSRFLADPTQSTWLLKAAQEARSHVEGTIRSNTCDLDCDTEQRGRPYTLRCTKNQASYQRRVEQRRQDLAHLTRLGGDAGRG